MNDESITTAPDSASDGIAHLCRQAVTLIEATDRPLKRVRVRAGDLTIEVEWPESGAPPDISAPLVAPPNGRVAAPDTPGSVVPGDIATVQSADDGSFVVCAPLVGTFYRASSPGARPFVEVGDDVVAGQQVAIVEAMKLMNPVEIEQPGRVREVLVPDGSPVEYGEALFVLVPASASSHD